MNLHKDGARSALLAGAVNIESAASHMRVAAKFMIDAKMDTATIMQALGRYEQLTELVTHIQQQADRLPE